MDADIASLKELITQRFDAADDRLDKLTEQVTRTNGRLQVAERDIAVLKDRLYLSAGAILVASGAWVVSLFR